MRALIDNPGTVAPTVVHSLPFALAGRNHLDRYTTQMDRCFDVTRSFSAVAELTGQVSFIDVLLGDSTS